MTTTSPEMPLAGAHCPNCQTTCVYEVPVDLLARGIASVEVSCHSCGTRFAAQLPELALPESMMAAPETPTPTPHAFDHGEDSAWIRPDVAAPAPPSGFRRVARIVVLGLMGIGVTGIAVGAGLIIFASVIMQTPPADRPAPETIATPETVASPETTPPQATPPQATSLAPARFVVAERGFTFSTTSLGQVMNISVEIANTGGTRGRPATIRLHLISADGTILMAWPLSPGGGEILPGEIPPGKILPGEIPQGESRRYAVQLIEPPAGVSSVEVEVN